MVKVPDELAELVGAESPAEWAFENLVHVDSGTAAAIFEHPGDTSLVIRVSEYPDGWFMLADAIKDFGDLDDGNASPFLPVIHWIGYAQGTFIGVSERLEKIDDDHPLAQAVEAVQKAITSNKPEDWERAESHVPGFRSFRSTLNARVDARESNFMRRGETLVFNDPYSAIPFEMLASLEGAYAVERESRLSLI
jgi:hypothetical protein